MQEKGAGKAALAGDLQALAVEEGAGTAAGRVEIAGDRIVDDADGDLAVLLEGDQRRPEGNVTDEVLRAVDRVDDPPSLARARAAEFLAEHPVLRERAAEDLDDHALGLAIGLGHRRVVGLDRDLEAAPVILQRDASGGPRRLDRGFQRRLTHRAGSSPGNGSPRSASTWA